jgi:cyclophilin family peptidyl-prolyl cis-trans isomerase
MKKNPSLRSLTLLAVVLVATVAAGCGTAPATSDTQLNSGSLQYNSNSTQEVLGTTSSSEPDQKDPMPVTSGAEPIKTLADFEPIPGTDVTLETSKGTIELTLFRDKAPLTTLNFLTLVKDGFYDGIVFHRVIPDFMAQFGDPLSKDPSKQALWGTGGAGYVIADEFSPELKHDGEGILSMANRGPNTGGSQVFITYAATPWLDGKHAVFGKVTSGMDVLRQLENGDTISKATIK